ELAKRLTLSLGTADKRAGLVDELSTQLEARIANLKSVEKRLSDFEQRLDQWQPVEKEITRSLEQSPARQSTVEALHADLENMYAMAEKTAADVREITSTQQEIERSKTLLSDVMSGLTEVRDTASTLDERKRQMAKAEERLARAEALIVDVR